MLIVWSGAGIVVPIMAVITLCITQFATDAAFGEGFYTAHGIPKLLALWITAALTWLLATALAKQKGRPHYNSRTGQMVMVKTRHSLFFIPVEYWAYILFGFGIFALFI
jgi:hypothetical protein